MLLVSVVEVADDRAYIRWCWFDTLSLFVYGVVGAASARCILCVLQKQRRPEGAGGMG